MSMVCAVGFSRCKWWRIGKLLGPGLSCIAATAASPYMRSGQGFGPDQTRMPHARGVAPARRDPPETRRPYASKEENGRGVCPFNCVRPIHGG